MTKKSKKNQPTPITHDDFPMHAIIKMKGDISRYRVIGHSENGVFLTRYLHIPSNGDVRYLTLAELKPVEEIIAHL